MDNPANCSLCKIAIIQFADENFEKRKEQGNQDLPAKPTLRVLTLFPHNKHCTIPKYDRPSSTMHRTRAGSGSMLLDFDFDTIIRDTYNDMIGHMESYQDPIHELPPGHFIVNGVKKGYPHDDQRYVHLPSFTSDGYLEFLDPAEHRRCIMAIALWFCNTMSIVEEVWDIQPLITSHIWTQPIEFADITTLPKPDKAFMDISCVFGGHAQKDGGSGRRQYIRPGDTNRIVHQICHSDFLPKEGVEVSDNPDLQGKFLSRTLAIPLKQPRNIFFGDISNKQRVACSQALWFNGDKSHFGESYLLGNPVEYCLLLHMHFESRFHPHQSDNLSLEVSINTYMPVEHVQLLQPIYLKNIARQDFWDILPTILTTKSKDMREAFAEITNNFVSNLFDKSPERAKQILECWCASVGFVINPAIKPTGNNPTESAESCANKRGRHN